MSGARIVFLENVKKTIARERHGFIADTIGKTDQKIGSVRLVHAFKATITQAGWRKNMTNLPDNLRDLWKQLYVLFDRHYLMDISSEEEWKSFWDDAIQIKNRHDTVPCLVDLLATLSDMIAKMAQERNRHESKGL